jgi:hypothetical protein
MLLLGEALLQEHPEVASILSHRFPFVLLDEMQDTSARQAQIIETALPPSCLASVQRVGDPNQAIFEDDDAAASSPAFPDPERRPVSLPNSFRFDSSIASHATRLAVEPAGPEGLQGLREVRYETQIQRLLRRPDASTRRILCLSAVFPSGNELDDFVAWITDDEPDGLHRETWRPTQQRFGLVEWRDDHARLTITLGPDQPFIPRYFDARQPTGRRRKTFPADQRELVIATAWRLVEEGQSALVFCPERRSVRTVRPRDH